MDDRNHMIADEAVNAVKSGRRPLLLSDRREHLVRLWKLFMKKWEAEGLPPVPIGFHIGKKKDDLGAIVAEAPHPDECSLLLGTYTYAQEALDDPLMDTLFLVMPKGDPEQTVGRVLRLITGKRKPFVVDFVDEEIEVCAERAEMRLKFYNKHGFEVKDLSSKKL